MNQQPLPYSRLVSDPNLQDLLDEKIRVTMLQFNCHSIGTITSVNTTKVPNGYTPLAQTVQVAINYQKSILVRQDNGTYLPTPLTYPILADVPFIILTGGQTNLTFPIAIGDTCLILFNDRDMDLWVSTGQNSVPNTTRLHAFADGIALIGLRNQNNLVQNYDSVRAALNGGNAVIGVNPTNNKVLISNDLSSATNGINTYGTTLNTLAQDLITQIESLNAALAAFCAGAGSGPSGSPVTYGDLTILLSDLLTATGTATIQLPLIASQIGDLLE